MFFAILRQLGRYLRYRSVATPLHTERPRVALQSGRGIPLPSIYGAGVVLLAGSMAIVMGKF